MAQKPAAWQIHSDASVTRLAELTPEYESHLEDWIEQDPGIVDDGLLLIARQYETEFGTVLDLLGVNQEGDLVVLELKRDKTLRETVAQALEYAAWASRLSYDDILAIAGKRFGSDQSFRSAFRDRFGTELPDALNQLQRILIVAPQISDATRAVVEYLAESYGMSINAVSFGMFPVGEHRILVREAVLDDAERAKPAALKRRPLPTIEQLLNQAAENDVAEPAEYLWSLRPNFLAPAMLVNGWCFRRRAVSGRYLTVFSVYTTPAVKRGAVVISLSPSNLADLAGRPLSEAEEFVKHAQTEIGQLEPGVWQGWHRLSLQSVQQAQTLATEIEAFLNGHSSQLNPSIPAAAAAGLKGATP